MTKPAATERFRSRGPSETVHEDRGPALIEPAAGRTVSRFKKRAAIYLPTGASRAIFLVAIFLATLIIFTLVLLGPITHLIAGQELSLLTAKERFEALNGIRQTLVAAAAGFAASAGLAFTGRTYALSKRGQEVDRFARASSMLTSEQQTERIGGLLAMEQMIREKTREAQGAVEVVRSFIRDYGRVDPAIYESALKSPQNWEDEDRCPHDVAVAMTVLGYTSPLPTRFMLDLSRIDIRQIGLAGSKFPAAKFFSCMMQGASFVGADLKHSRLDGSIMRGAWLKETDLRRATLRNVDLRGANLTRARIDASQLLPAIIDESTILDDSVRVSLLELKEQVRKQAESTIAEPVDRPTESSHSLTTMTNPNETAIQE